MRDKLVVPSTGPILVLSYIFSAPQMFMGLIFQEAGTAGMRTLNMLLRTSNREIVQNSSSLWFFFEVCPKFCLENLG